MPYHAMLCFAWYSHLRRATCHDWSGVNCLNWSCINGITPTASSQWTTGIMMMSEYGSELLCLYDQLIHSYVKWFAPSWPDTHPLYMWTWISIKPRAGHWIKGPSRFWRIQKICKSSTCLFVCFFKKEICGLSFFLSQTTPTPSRFWPNHSSRMYLFDHIEEFRRTLKFRPGDLLNLTVEGSRIFFEITKK